MRPKRWSRIRTTMAVGEALAGDSLSAAAGVARGGLQEPAMFSPEAMAQAQKQMANMTPEQMRAMQQQMANMDPATLANVQRATGMSEADIKNAQAQMKNMNSDDFGRGMEQMKNMTPDQMAAQQKLMQVCAEPRLKLVDATVFGPDPDDDAIFRPSE